MDKSCRIYTHTYIYIYIYIFCLKDIFQILLPFSSVEIWWCFFKNQGICDHIPSVVEIRIWKKFARKQKTHWFRAILVRLAVVRRDPITFNRLMVVINWNYLRIAYGSSWMKWMMNKNHSWLLDICSSSQADQVWCVTTRYAIFSHRNIFQPFSHTTPHIASSAFFVE